MIDTGTVCAFPWAFPRGTPEDVISNATTDALCTVTYAQWIGPVHLVFQITLAVMAYSCFVGMLYRVYRLRAYTHTKKQRFRDHAAAPFMVMAIIFNGLFGLEVIDILAFHGIFTAQTVYILDEFLTASMIACGIILVDFWIKMSRGFNRRHGLGVAVKAALIAATLVAFPLTLIIGTIDYMNFYLWEAVKSFLGAGICAIFLILSGRAVRELYCVLTGSPNTADAAKVLVKKYALFAFLVTMGGVALFVNAILVLSMEDWRWAIRVEDQYDAVQVTIRVLYALTAISTTIFFTIPASPTSPPPGSPVSQVASHITRVQAGRRATMAREAAAANAQRETGSDGGGGGRDDAKVDAHSASDSAVDVVCT